MSAISSAWRSTNESSHVAGGTHRYQVDCVDNLEVAHRIAHRLTASALWQGNECTWWSHTPSETEAGDPDKIGESVYRGTAGIALFLLQAYHATRDQRLIDPTIGALRYSWRRTAEQPSVPIGFYAGSTGLMYALARAGTELDHPFFVAAARRLLDRVACADVAIPDVVGGSAGAILGLLLLRNLEGGFETIDVAIQLAETLLRQARQGLAGWSWGGSRLMARDLTGVSHGGSGIAHALLELYAVTRDGAYRYAAEQALAYERFFFDAAQGNWIDLRHKTLSGALDGATDRSLQRKAAESVPRFEPSYGMAWCHGAPGMASARLRAFEILGTPRHRVEAEAGIATTKRVVEATFMASDYTLCHGTGGRCEGLFAAADVLHDEEAATLLMRVAAYGADNYEFLNQSWKQTRGGSGVGDPTLMLGEAGIGYFYLRIADRTAPSVLSLVSIGEPRGDGRAPGATDDRAGHLRRQYVDLHLGRILRVARRLADRLPDLMQDDALAAFDADRGRSDARLAFEAVSTACATHTNIRTREWLLDALGPERACFEFVGSIPNQCDEYIDELKQLDFAEVNWDNVFVQFAPHARLVKTQWDWDQWLKSAAVEPDPPNAVVFLAFCRGGMTHHCRLNDLAAAVFLAIGSGGRFNDVVIRAAGNIDPVDASVEWRQVVSAQIYGAYREGILKLT